MNCSTSFIRHISSSGVDVYTAVAMAAGALYGPKHGGANEAVIRMLESIGSKDNIGKFILEVKQKKKVLFGFGHRVYKNYDPRAKIVKNVQNLFIKDCFWSLLNLWKRAFNWNCIRIIKNCASRLVLYHKKAISKCWFLLWSYLQSYGFPNWHVPSLIHNSKSGWMDRSLGLIFKRSRKQYLQAKTELHRIWKKIIHRNVLKKRT